MPAITVRTDTGVVTVSPEDRAVIGRESDCTVLCSNPEVSRHHAEVRHEHGMWILRDLDSRHGTYVDGRRVTEVALAANVVATLGSPGSGEKITFELLDGGAASAASGGPGTVLGSPPPGPPSVPLPSAPPPLGAPPSVGAGRPPDPAWINSLDAANGDPARTIQVTADDTTLRVQVDGKDLRFTPGQTVILGRDASSAVVFDNPIVSRGHAQITHDGRRWILRDLNSAQGTFVHGERTREHALQGVSTAWLGPPEAGEKVVLITSGTTEVARKGRGRPVLVAVVALVVLAVLGGGLVWALSGGDEPERSTPDLDTLKDATVRIDLETTEFVGFGSGTIIDPTGLILTNAHVVEGHDQPGSELTVSFFEGDDVPVRPAYTGEVVAVDTYLDLALVELDRALAGSERNPTDLTHVPVGDSNELAVGDQLWVLGHPGIAESASVTLTAGAVGSFIRDDLLDENRAWINTDANIAQGNSGGLAANRAGELVAVPTAIRFERGADGFEERVNRLRPVNLAMPMIEAVLAGDDYEPVQLSETDGFVLVARDLAGECEPASITGYTEEFVISGMPVGDPLFYAVVADIDGTDEILVDEQVDAREGQFCLSLQLPPELETTYVFVVAFALDRSYTQVVAQFVL